MANQTVELVIVSADMRVSKDYKKMNPCDSYPMLESEEGILFETIAICKYLAAKGGFAPSNKKERVQIEQYVQAAET